MNNMNRTAIEVGKLKLKAIKLYSQDGGTMYECFSESDYLEMIREHGTAKNVWRLHLEAVEAQRECAYSEY